LSWRERPELKSPKVDTVGSLDSPPARPYGPGEWGPLEKEMLATLDIEKLFAVERATVEK
jgi:hypothetical protein